MAGMKQQGSGEQRRGESGQKTGLFGDFYENFFGQQLIGWFLVLEASFDTREASWEYVSFVT